MARRILESTDGFGVIQSEDAGAEKLFLSTTVAFAPNYPGATDLDKIQAAIDDMAASENGGTVKLKRNKTYNLAGLPVMKTRVRLDMNGATINATLGSGNVYGLRVIGNFIEVFGGAINVISTGSPSSQAIFHAPIGIGIHNNCGDSVASPNPANFVRFVHIHHMTLSSTRPFGPVLQGMGSSHVIINDIYIPDSANHSGIHWDWGNVGPIDTNPDPLRIINTRASFDSGLIYTTHPQHIVIRRIFAGKLTHPDSCLVRLSACFGVTVENAHCEEIGYAAFMYTSGDLGSEFARDGRAAHNYINDVPLAHRGIKVRGMTAMKCNYHGAFVDSFGDNIGKAVTSGPYTPIRDPFYFGNIEISDSIFIGKNASGVGNGMHVQDTNGGVKFRNVTVTGFELGGYCDTMTAVAAAVTKGVKYEGCLVHGNRSHGIAVRDIGPRMADINITNNTIFGNGTDAGAGNAAGIRIFGGTRIKARNNLLGEDSESTQYYGILTDSAATEVEIVGNHVKGVKSSGIAYATPNSTDYSVYKLFKDNTAAAGITYLAGCNILPVRHHLTLDGRTVREFISAKASLSGDTTPPAGAWIKGDSIIFDDCAASGKKGSACTTAGSPGTWKQFGAIDA